MSGCYFFSSFWVFFGLSVFLLSWISLVQSNGWIIYACIGDSWRRMGYERKEKLLEENNICKEM